MGSCLELCVCAKTQWCRSFSGVASTGLVYIHPVDILASLEIQSPPPSQTNCISLLYLDSSGMVLDARVGIISGDDISAMRVAAKLLMKVGYCTVGKMTSQKTDVCASLNPMLPCLASTLKKSYETNYFWRMLCLSLCKIKTLFPIISQEIWQ